MVLVILRPHQVLRIPSDLRLDIGNITRIFSVYISLCFKTILSLGLGFFFFFLAEQVVLKSRGHCRWELVIH